MRVLILASVIYVALSSQGMAQESASPPREVTADHFLASLGAFGTFGTVGSIGQARGMLSSETTASDAFARLPSAPQQSTGLTIEPLGRGSIRVTTVNEELLPHDRKAVVSDFVVSVFDAAKGLLHLKEVGKSGEVMARMSLRVEGPENERNLQFVILRGDYDGLMGRVRAKELKQNLKSSIARLNALSETRPAIDSSEIVDETNLVNWGAIESAHAENSADAAKFLFNSGIANSFDLIAINARTVVGESGSPAAVLRAMPGQNYRNVSVTVDSIQPAQVISPEALNRSKGSLLSGFYALTLSDGDRVETEDFHVVSFDPEKKVVHLEGLRSNALRASIWMAGDASMRFAIQGFSRPLLLETIPTWATALESRRREQSIPLDLAQVSRRRLEVNARAFNPRVDFIETRSRRAVLTPERQLVLIDTDFNEEVSRIPIHDIPGSIEIFFEGVSLAVEYRHLGWRQVFDYRSGRFLFSQRPRDFIRRELTRSGAQCQSNFVR